MLTFRFKTKKGYDVSKICYNYSGMFREMYVNFCMNESLANCHTFENYIREKYGFDSWFYNSCRVDVKTKIAHQETNDEKNKINRPGCVHIGFDDANIAGTDRETIYPRPIDRGGV